MRSILRKGFILNFSFFPNQLRTLSEIFSTFPLGFFGRVVKTAIYVFRGTVWRKPSFWEMFSLELRILREKLTASWWKLVSESAKTAFWVSWGTFCGNSNLFTFLFFLIILGYFVKFFQRFVEKFWEGLSKLQSTCSEEQTNGQKINLEFSLITSDPELIQFVLGWN